jgi:hypothetical protein
VPAGELRGGSEGRVEEPEKAVGARPVPVEEARCDLVEEDGPVEDAEAQDDGCRDLTQRLSNAQENAAKSGAPEDDRGRRRPPCERLSVGRDRGGEPPLQVPDRRWVPAFIVPTA